MRIGHILPRPFPPEIRLEKEARTMRAAGHEIHLLADMRAGVVEPVRQTYPDLAVQRVPPARGVTKLIHRGIYYSTFHEHLWLRAIRAFVAERGIDVLQVHDIPLARSAVAVARAARIPVLLDLHENYPAAIALWRSGRSRLLRWITANPVRWLAYERWAVRQAWHVLVVVDEAKERLIATHGLPADKITTVMNVEELTPAGPAQPSPPAGESPDQRFTVLYAGGGGVHRGLETAVLALSHLLDLAPPPRLVVIGPPAADRDALAALATRLGVAHLLELVAWEPLDRVRARMARSDVCIVPHHQSAHTDATIPHKLFQAMGAARPAVVSSCRPLARIVQETQAGLVFRSGDAADLARQLRRLHASAALRQELGARGAAAVRDRYNWEREARTLVALFDSGLRNPAGAAVPGW